MNYTIGWIDATLRENFSKEELKLGTFMIEDIGVHIYNDDCSWIDYEALHNFKAKNDNEAIEYTKKYVEDSNRPIDVFSLSRNNKVIFTEESL